MAYLGHLHMWWFSHARGALMQTPTHVMIQPCSGWFGDAPPYRLEDQKRRYSEHLHIWCFSHALGVQMRTSTHVMIQPCSGCLDVKNDNGTEHLLKILHMWWFSHTLGVQMLTPTHVMFQPCSWRLSRCLGTILTPSTCAMKHTVRLVLLCLHVRR